MKVFDYKKSLGQNFIYDINLLNAIVSDSCVDKDDFVLEIGTGMGTLTAVLANRVKHVLSFEIDKRLEFYHTDLLHKNLNVSVRYEDFLLLSDRDICSFGNYKVVANLPYYITTQIIFKLLECGNPPKSITIMVQKEVADRMTAKPNTKDFGILTLNVALHTKPKLMRIVKSEVFTPQPKVDSALMHLTSYDNSCVDKQAVKKLVKCAFGSRRKTLVNNILACYNVTRLQIVQCLTNLGIDASVRGEALNLEQFIALQEQIKKLC
ncbi:MAG: 16S rRNA (adenine(1518)-N(6)/adenine(1519)-N(6))-dimethyltransferase RsmA [Clostridiales bacterium]|jgi:16S rRNA (adenine1518-N6/adenine1519-N6)-dimethyltransferase|nr:16S rRNA (adenine(1518)-N(6)/adenine(1519)-N(6))-dimethyltransferase RsmA [Clostridiales bacterium]